MRVDKNANRQRGPRKSALWCHRICDRAYFPQISKPFHKFQLICTRAQKDAVISANKQTQERKTSRSYDGGQRRFEQFKRNCKISKVGHPYLVSLLGVQRSDAFLGPTIKQLSMGLIWSSSDHLTVIIIKIKKNTSMILLQAAVQFSGWPYTVIAFSKAAECSSFLRLVYDMIWQYGLWHRVIFPNSPPCSVPTKLKPGQEPIRATASWNPSSKRASGWFTGLLSFCTEQGQL